MQTFAFESSLNKKCKHCDKWDKCGLKEPAVHWKQHQYSTVYKVSWKKGKIYFYLQTVFTSLLTLCSNREDPKQDLMKIIITSNIFCFLFWFGFFWNLQISSFCYCYEQIEFLENLLESQKRIIYLTPFDHCGVTWCLLVVWRTSFGKKGQFQGQLWRSEEEVAVRQMHIFALIIKLHFCTLFGTGHWAASIALQMLSPKQLQSKPVSHLSFFLNTCTLHCSCNSDFQYPFEIITSNAR